jgi:outer membrane protein OmpU
MVATGAATAADVTVGMGWSLSYTSADSDEQGGTASWTMGDSIKFTTTGELDNGWTATAYLEVDETGGTGIDDEKLTLDMGDMGTVGFGSKAGHGFGIDAVKNFLPGADTPAISMGFTDLAYVGGANTTNGVLGYQLAVGDTGVTIGVEQAVATAGGYDRSMSIKYTNADIGFSFGVGTTELEPDNGSGGDNETAIGASYTAGAFKIGANHNETDYGSTTNDIDNQAYGISYAVNDDLTISYQVVTNSRDTAAQDEQITQVAASYSMGSISFAGYIGKQSDVSGTAGSDDAEKHISMSISF